LATLLAVTSAAVPSRAGSDPSTSSITNSTQPEKPPAASSTTATKNGKHAAPRKKVVHEGGTSEPTAQLAPGLTPQQAAQERRNTEDLLASAEANLQKVSGRSLDQNRQATVDQVKDFMKQARVANDAGDFTRARNLAFKAQLLSDDLARH
jgi:hypothetical protein